MSFSRIHLRAMNKIGDIYCPGFRQLPKFSEVGCVQHIEKIASSLPTQDLSDLKLLLSILFYIPKPILKFILWFFELELPLPGPIGTNARKIRFGLRGLAFSLYYSGLRGDKYRGPLPTELIGFKY